MAYIIRKKYFNKESIKTDRSLTKEKINSLISNKKNAFKKSILNFPKFKVYILLNIFIIINLIVPIISESYINITVNAEGTQKVIDSYFIKKIQIEYKGSTLDSTNEVDVETKKSIKIIIKEG